MNIINTIDSKLKVTEMRMLRLAYGMTRPGRNRTECIRGSLGATNMTGKTRENRWRQKKYVNGEEVEKMREIKEGNRRGRGSSSQRKSG